MPDVKVLYVVSMTEHERGWGQRPEGYLLFLTESDADVYIKDTYALYPKEVPDCYISYNKIGYREAHPSRLKAIKKGQPGSAYIRNLSELIQPATD